MDSDPLGRSMCIIGHITNEGHMTLSPSASISEI